MDWITRGTLAAAIGTCLLASSCAAVDNDKSVSRVYSRPEQAAQAALDEFRKLSPAKNDADDEFAKDLGFASAKEAASAQLGSPLRIWQVPVGRLKDFQSNTDPNRILEDSHSVIFPLLVNGEVRSSLTVSEDKRGWRVAAKGSPKTIRKIQRQKPSESNFLVMVIPLRSQFIGDRKAGEIMLTPIEEAPHMSDLKVGRERPAQQVFADLAPFAKKFYEDDQRYQQMEKRGRTHLAPSGGVPDKAPDVHR